MDTSILYSAHFKQIKKELSCAPCYFTAWLVDHGSGVHHLIPGVAFLLDCRLNDSNVSVELYRRKQSELSFKRVYLPDRFVKQNGQNFTIIGVPSNGWFTFQCRTAVQAGTPSLKKEVKVKRALGLK